MITNGKSWTAPVARVGERDGLFLHRDPVNGEIEFSYPDPYAGQAKWPAWLVTLGVVILNAAIWTAVIALGAMIFKLLG